MTDKKDIHIDENVDVAVANMRWTIEMQDINTDTWWLKKLSQINWRRSLILLKNLKLGHGGPIAEPQDAQFIFDNTEGIGGFFGASSIERLATEPAIEGQARAFKELKT